jgi:hypothetical protein
MSALIIGTCAPDFEYFLRLAPHGRFGHTLPGVFVLTLPLALLILWLFNGVVRAPLVAMLPDAIQRRLTAPDRIYASRLAAFALAAASALLGIMTHLLWDSFTHVDTWPYLHWPFLSQTLRLPVAGSVQYYKVFQHGSTILGACILAAWFAHWYRTTAPSSRLDKKLRSSQKLTIAISIFTIAFLGSTLRAIIAARFPTVPTGPGRFIGEVVVTFIALIWWQLVLYGLIFFKRASRTHVSKTETA